MTAFQVALLGKKEVWKHVQWHSCLLVSEEEATTAAWPLSLVGAAGRGVLLMFEWLNHSHYSTTSSQIYLGLRSAQSFRFHPSQNCMQYLWCGSFLVMLTILKQAKWRIAVV